MLRPIPLRSSSMNLNRKRLGQISIFSGYCIGKKYLGKIMPSRKGILSNNVLKLYYVFPGMGEVYWRIIFAR